MVYGPYRPLANNTAKLKIGGFYILMPLDEAAHCASNHWSHEIDFSQSEAVIQKNSDSAQVGWRRNTAQVVSLSYFSRENTSWLLNFYVNFIAETSMQEVLIED